MIVWASLVYLLPEYKYDMKKVFILLSVICIALSANAQVTNQTEAKKSAFVAAKTMNDALVLKDYDKYVEYNHPKVLEQTPGGRSGMVMQVAKQINDIEESGNYITAIWANMPEVVLDTAGEWQCTLQQFMEYRLPSGKVKAETTIIGISPDKGKAWYFLDVAGRKLEDIKAMFPTLSSKLKVGAPVEPVFTPNTTTE